MSDHPGSRRHFLARAAVLLAALPLLGAATRVFAAPLKKLPLSNAQAKSLSYTEDASTSTNAAHKPGSMCKNCQFFTPATGACALFAGFSVSPVGWCTAWAKKA